MRSPPRPPLYCQTCSRLQHSRLLPSCVHLSACSSNRFTRTLHDSHCQGHILRTGEPHRPPPAPLVLQVLVSLYMSLIGVSAFWCLAHHMRFFVCETPPPSTPTGGGGAVLLRSVLGLPFLSLSLPLPSSTLLFSRERLLLRITFLKITAPSPRSSFQGVTVQRALRP
jgi:hypothetical protein